LSLGTGVRLPDQDFGGFGRPAPPGVDVQRHFKRRKLFGGSQFGESLAVSLDVFRRDGTRDTTVLDHRLARPDQCFERRFGGGLGADAAQGAQQRRLDANAESHARQQLLAQRRQAIPFEPALLVSGDTATLATQAAGRLQAKDVGPARQLDLDLSRRQRRPDDGLRAVLRQVAGKFGPRVHRRLRA
jgi:hypothetical protein